MKNIYKIYKICSNGDIIKCSRFNRRGGDKLKAVKTKNGYSRVSMIVGGKRMSFMVHRLIGMCFVKGKSKSKKFINHKDGDKMNNKSSNLEWCTHSENMRHALKMGLWKGNRKLSDEQIVEIRKSDLSQRKLGAIYGVSGSAIKKIKDKKTYA